MKLAIPGVSLLGQGVELLGPGGVALLGPTLLGRRIQSAGPHSPYPGAISYPFGDTTTTSSGWTPWLLGLGGLVVGTLVGKYVL